MQAEVGGRITGNLDSVLASATNKLMWVGKRFLEELNSFSCVQIFATQWTVVHQAPLSIGFSKQEYWSGLSCPPPGDLPDPRIEPAFLCLPHWQAGSLPLVPPGKP